MPHYHYSITQVFVTLTKRFTSVYSQKRNQAKRRRRSSLFFVIGTYSSRHKKEEMPCLLLLLHDSSNTWQSPVLCNRAVAAIQLDSTRDD
jgi:hypothetical protein